MAAIIPTRTDADHENHLVRTLTLCGESRMNPDCLKAREGVAQVAAQAKALKLARSALEWAMAMQERCEARRNEAFEELQYADAEVEAARQKLKALEGEQHG